MRICIFTLPIETNYGGILQAYAMQVVLKKMGHVPVTINLHHKRSYDNLYSNLKGFIKRLIESFVFKKDVSIKWNPFLSNKDYKLLCSRTQRFIDRNINLTKEVSLSNIEQAIKNDHFDAYIVGSDQVWTPMYYPYSFLNFVNNDSSIKIVYAASCNIPFVINKETLSTCTFLASKFRGISVREKHLLQLCNQYLNKEGVFVLDPTLLISPKDYLKSVEDDNSIKQPALFSYILDVTKEKEDIVNYISLKLSVPCYWAQNPKQFRNGGKYKIEQCIYNSVDSWLLNLEKADYVITDSFHGMAFAINFNKQFVVIGNRERGLERFESLLGELELLDRIIEKKDLSMIDRLLKTKIDYTKVNSLLQEWRIKSLNFLTSCLTNN